MILSALAIQGITGAVHERVIPCLSVPTPRRGPRLFEGGVGMNRKCRICKNRLPLEMFGRSSTRSMGLNNRCKPCDNRRGWLSRKRNPIRMRKQLARNAVYRAVRRGTIKKPSKCERCSSLEKLHGHHDNYEKRLEVKWLCELCHILRHKEILYV